MRFLWWRVTGRKLNDPLPIAISELSTLNLPQLVARTGIEPVSLYAFFKTLIHRELVFSKTVFLALSILTFILTCYGKRRKAQKLSVLDGLFHQS